MDTWTLMWTGSLQGLGMGLIYVPLATLSFGTLARAYRDEGTAMFSLIRNIGSSIGIAVATTLFTRNTQMMHSRLGENITPYLDPWHPAISGTASMAAMNRTITSQAEMIAYNNNFKLMMFLTLCAIPLIALLRKPKPHPQADPVVVE
jgi:DHA2 family multidrug resistance protein